MTSIVKATTKGQITIPARWRKQFATDQYLVKEKAGSLIISPLDLDKIEKANDYTIFDAVRDNKGQGIPAKDFLKILKKINK